MARVSIHGRRMRAVTSGVPSFVSSATSVQDGGGWTAVALSQTIAAYLLATYGTHTAWGGSTGWASMVDAFGDPAYDSAGQRLIFNLGGHDDLWANPVVALDMATLAWSEIAPPVPASKIPPDYSPSGGEVNYPSTYSTGYFETAPPITDAADLAYAAPVKSRPARHCYGGFNYFSGTAVHSYKEPAIVNLSTGAWTIPSSKFAYGNSIADCRTIYVGNSLLSNGDAATRAANYGTTLLWENTGGLVDSSTGKLWLTLTSGSGGGAWRNSIMRCNPTTHAVEAIYDFGGMVVDGTTSLVMAGRYLYIFSPASKIGNRGWRLHMDDNVIEALSFSGTHPDMNGATTQEVHPGFYNGTNIYRWNHGVTADRDAMFKLDLTPTSGAGTSGSPYVMTQTRVAMASSAIPAPSYRYRLSYVEAWGGVLVVPTGGSANAYFLKV